MVSTRACAMNKNKKGVKSTGNIKPKMKTNKFANCSNPESEDDEQNTNSNECTINNVPPAGSSGSSIKVTLKKTRSCSSTSSRESTQSFEVVRNVLPTVESVSDEEDTNQDENTDENQKESDNEKNSDKQADKIAENEKESDDEDSQNGVSSDNDEIEILSDDSEEELSVKTNNESENPVPVKEESKLPINTVLHLKTEETSVPKPTVIKKEECTAKVKSLKEELLKESSSDTEIVVVNDDDNDGPSEAPLPCDQTQNGVEKKETKETKFKVNVRSFDDLAAPRPVSLINMPPPGQLEVQSNFMPNGSSPFPPPYLPHSTPNMPCEVCGARFDSLELLHEHKTSMKHYTCSYKGCELLRMENQQEYLDHQRTIHNVMQSPVQQLAHQVQRLPAMGYDQLQSGIPSLPENLQPPPGVPNMYNQTLRMPTQPVPMQRSMRPMMRSSMQHSMMSSRGRGAPRATRGRGMSMNANMVRGSPMKRPASMSMRQPTPAKRVATDRNPYSNNMNKTPQIVKSLSESLTKSLVSANKPLNSPTQQDVVNLFSKRGLTISTVDTVNNISLPAGLSLNSAVSIIPTSPHKGGQVPNKNVDTVDLTGPDKPRATKYYPCDVCSKTYSSVEAMYEHVSVAHKSVNLPFRCNLCSGSYPNADILNRHRLSVHKTEVNTNIPFVIPIIDFTKAGTAAKLQAMGITDYLPVAQLDNQNGQFGVPIMSVSRPGSLDGLRYSNFFNLGCVRKM